jgi:hypothetical protein
VSQRDWLHQTYGQFATNIGVSPVFALRTQTKLIPAFAILHLCAALDPHTDGILNAKKKGSASNALTSLAGQTDDPHYGWRRPGY